MRRLVDEGWAPSTAAAAVLAESVPERARAPEPAATDGGDDRIEDGAVVDQFVTAASGLDPRSVERVLDEMFATSSFERVVERLLMPALDALGEAWASGRVTVAAEHAASQAIHRRLAGAYQAAAVAASTDHAVLVGLPPGARHELGALAFSVVARRAGLPVLYLGADLPVSEWAATVTRIHAVAAVVVAVTPDDRRPAAAVAEALLAVRPQLIVALGGRNAPTPGVELKVPTGRSVVALPDSVVEASRVLASALGSGSRTG
jgi:MerR family transcriptional regulator, light-induced transcriptional regulator